MTQSDYALVISILAIVVAIFGLVWNVWQKFLFVKPTLQVTFNVSLVMVPTATGYSPAQNKLLSLAVTNLGPGPVIVDSCIVRLDHRLWKKGTFALLNPIDGDPTATPLRGKGAFGGGLPATLEPGHVKRLYFPHERDSVLKEDLTHIGVTDTYGRNSWARRRDIQTAKARYKKDFS